MKSDYRPLKALLGVALVTAGALPAFANTWLLTYEQPAVQATTATFFSSGVENFDTRAVGAGQTFTSSFGGSSINGTYSGVQVAAADQYGGAGGIGRYAVIFGSSYSLNLSAPVNYFGYWLSALDPANVVTFYDGATVVGQFSAGTVFGAAVTGNAAYFGNPNSPFFGNNSLEPYAFVNFYSTGTGDKFDRIVFSESTNGGYETDNHTVGLYQSIGGIPVVPEPSSAAIILAGLTVLRLLRYQKAAVRK